MLRGEETRLVMFRDYLECCDQWEAGQHAYTSNICVPQDLTLPLTFYPRLHIGLEPAHSAVPKGDLVRDIPPHPRWRYPSYHLGDLARSE